MKKRNVFKSCLSRKIYVRNCTIGLYPSVLIKQVRDFIFMPIHAHQAMNNFVCWRALAQKLLVFWRRCYIDLHIKVTLKSAREGSLEAFRRFRRAWICFWLKCIFFTFASYLHQFVSIVSRQVSVLFLNTKEKKIHRKVEEGHGAVCFHFLSLWLSVFFSPIFNYEYYISYEAPCCSKLCVFS